jgi:acetyltransferase EpsM
MEVVTPQPLLILGAGSFAREAADVVSLLPGFQLDGFVESMDRERCGRRLEGSPVYWVDELERFAESHVCICALGSMHRAAFIELAASRGMRFVALIHPQAVIAPSASVGAGSYVGALAAIGAHTVIGRHVLVNRGALIGHDVRVDDCVTIGPGANIGGASRIGSRTYVGIGATIVDRIAIGPGSMVGAGALVHRNLPERVMVAGSPARIVKRDFEGF